MVSMNEIVTGAVEEPPWFGAGALAEVRKQFDLLTPGLPPLAPLLPEPAQPAIARVAVMAMAHAPSARRPVGLAIGIMP
jgi:hypothetical protein